MSFDHTRILDHISASVRSLRFRLMVWNFTAAVLTAIGILAAVREGVRYTLFFDLDQALQEDLREIRSYFHSSAPWDWRSLRDELNRKAQTHDYHGWFVAFIGRDGRAAWTSQNAPPEVVRFQPGKAAGLLHLGHYRIRYSQIADTGEIAAVAVGCNEEFIARDMHHIDRLVMIVGGIVVLIAPIGGYLLAGRTTKILAGLIRTTSHLRPSELKERLPTRATGDELDALANTINGLLDRIADYLAQKHDFLANAAHELRTPLAAIRSSVEVALAGDRNEQEYRELLAEIIDQCSALESLVSQLLLLAESDADRLITSAEPIAFDKVVARSIDMFQAVAEHHGIRLTANQLLPVAVLGNRHHLRQVLNNLLDNAIKFTAARWRGESNTEGGEIRVTLVRDDQRRSCVLQIEDNGPGIAAESLPFVFDRFYRCDKSRGRDTGVGGAGLGLSICKAIIDAHHGQIAVASQAGAGAAFTITLPLAPVVELGSQNG